MTSVILISDYITPVIYIDPNGDIPLILAILAIVSFGLTTYALFEEVQSVVNPIINNIEIFVGSQSGASVEAFDFGISETINIFGWLLNSDGLHEVTWGHESDYTFYSNSG